MELHSLRGNIFETYIVSELVKACHNQRQEPPLYYWRDSQGHEVDVIIEDGENLVPIEIKSGQTVSSAMFKGLNYWRALDNTTSGMLILWWFRFLHQKWIQGVELVCRMN